MNQLNHEQQQLLTLYNNLPFNQVLGLHYLEHGENQLSLGFAAQEKLIGNISKNILHGGVIASTIDACGGALALMLALNKMQGLSEEEKMARLFRSSTVDLRVDYLEPGSGTNFIVKAQSLRSGKRVAVMRIELTNNHQTLIAAGAATYLIG